MANAPTSYQAITRLFNDTRPTSLVPLESPNLDDRSERQLAEDAIALVGRVSEGKLNDFTPGSPTRALMEGHAHIQAKIAYLANQVGRKASIEWLQVAGIQRIAGKAAVVTLEFTLTTPLSTPYSIPAGFEVRASRVSFRTAEPLTIAPGFITGTVTAVCTEAGSIGSVGPDQVKRPLVPLAYLASVTNPLPAIPGEDGETDEQVIARGFSSLRRRNLVSQEDYEAFSREALGTSLVCRAYGKMDATGRALDIPAVTVAACTQTGQLLTQAEKSALTSALNLRGHITVEHIVADVVPVLIYVQTIVTATASADATRTANDIAIALEKYLSPSERWIERQITASGLAYEIRKAGGDRLTGVDLLFFGTPGEPVNRDSFYTGRFQTLAYQGINMTVLQGNESYSFAFGDGDPD